VTPDELQSWIWRHREPAIRLIDIPDHDALGELMTTGRAECWKAPDGIVYVASLVSPPPRSSQRHTDRIQAETDCEEADGNFDTLPSRSVDDADPGLVVALAEIAGIRAAKWIRAGNRRIPCPVILYLGRQMWPPRGTEIVNQRHEHRDVKITGVCPVCQGRKLPTLAYCCLCRRWGLDHLIRQERKRPPRKTEKPKAAAKFTPKLRRPKKEKVTA